MTSAPRVLITHAYSVANKGDAALLSVLVHELRRVLPGAEIDILTMDRVQDGEHFEGAAVHPSFMSLFRFRSPSAVSRTTYAVATMLGTFLWAATRRTTGLRVPLPRDVTSVVTRYDRADLIVGVGGGYLRGLPGLNNLFNLVTLLHPLYLASVLGKPTVLYSQSIGPFGYRLEELMIRNVLNRHVELLLVREDKSMALLRSLGADRRIRRSVDAGFLLEAGAAVDVRARLSIPAADDVVGVTVRKWLPPEGQDRYETAVAELVDHIVSDPHRHVVFIPQVTSTTHQDDDRTASRDVARRIADTSRVHVLEDVFDERQIKAVYGELDLLVGTRFHSVIFALTSFVPALAIEYEHKTSGILADLDLSQWWRPIDAVTGPELVELFDALSETRTTYVEHLRAVIPEYVERARTAAEETREAFLQAAEPASSGRLR